MADVAERVEARTQQIGGELLRAVGDYEAGRIERVQDWLLTRAAADTRFRTRLLRYLDVLAALDFDSDGSEAKRLAREYFAGGFPSLPLAVRAALRLATARAIPARLFRRAAHGGAGLVARRFITDPGDAAVASALAQLREAGRHPSLDLLGEEVLSEHEADAYVESYLRLLGQLAGEDDAGVETLGGSARLQISLKLSSLTSHFNPADPEGTIARVRPRLEAICERAEDAGVGLTVDMEQFAYRDLTWELFTRAFARGERFGAWRQVGLVLQTYLRRASDHARAMLDFARSRGAAFQVRLVKGAYWDFETITALANGWTAPVFGEKAETDAEFERVLARLVEAVPLIRPAVGSHNARAHSLAQALAESAGLPPHAIEHQTLFRTAEGMSRALSGLGWIVRDYVPVGERLPGMAYLVRRILENSSQLGFLLQSRSGASPDALLRPPPKAASNPPTPAPQRFRRAPAGRWFDPEFREAFDAALEKTRADWGEHRPIAIAGHCAAETLEIHSPSHPESPPVGSVDLAGREAVEAAIAQARRGAQSWRTRSVAQRCEILRASAEELESRGAEFAAWIVHEGGRDRVDAYAEVEEAVDALRYYAAEAEALFSRHAEHITPRGVVGVIPPWNFSLAIPCAMTAAALVCGNAVILKPAEQTPLIAGRLVDLLHARGVPEDALIWLPGRGEVAGAALAAHPRVAMIAFTGSRAVGTLLHETVARVEPVEGDVKKLVAELGGKNPIVVFADADLDEAIQGTLRSAFGHANQKCSAASRVLVQRPVAQRFRERLIEAARSLRVGRADEPSTEINPVIDREAEERVRKAAVRARAECEILLDRFDEPDHPLGFGPLIVELPRICVASSSTATEELFAPVLLLVEFEREHEAYALANATSYGLTAGVYTRSPARLERAVAALRAGNIYVNRPITGARVGVEPFGGMRMSGTGPKAGGPDYLWAFVRRSDAPRDARGAPGPVVATSLPQDVAQRWEARLEERLEYIDRAARRLGGVDREAARWVRWTIDAARDELGRPQPTVPVAGQRTELWYDTPRGVGVVHATGPAAACWLVGALAAGNACVVVDSPELRATASALLDAGVPPSALQLDLASDSASARLLALGSCEDVAFAALDRAGPLARQLAERLGPTGQSQSWLKALVFAGEGPQPGEDGFARRFALPRLVAVNTLRHGAELALRSDA